MRFQREISSVLALHLIFIFMLSIRSALCLRTSSFFLHQQFTIYERKMSAFAGSGDSSIGAGAAAISEDHSYLVHNAESVLKRIVAATEKAGRDANSVQLVAVSKTKPASDISALYAAGYRKFGENYFQELTEKAPTLPDDIQWHFIGHLQSGKASKLVRDVPNLAVVETIDSIKLASKLNNACESAERATPLKIYLQVDTSGEDTKSGVLPVEAPGLATEIKAQCPRLEIAGLMTIGAPGDLTCFDRLVEARIEVAAALGIPPETLGLSMGMSGDFEDAIARGATSVRVGSTIFGERNYAT